MLSEKTKKYRKGGDKLAKINEYINKIICGDNVEVLREFPDECIDLTVTSPPYDNLRTYNGFDWDFEALAKELYRVTKDGGVGVWVVGDETKNFRSEERRVGNESRSQ